MPKAAQAQTRGQVLSILPRGPATVDEITAELDDTAVAVRVQLAALERDALVVRGGLQRRPTEPSLVYRLSAAGEQGSPRAGVPMPTHLLHVPSAQLPREEFDALMREVDRWVLTGRPRPNGGLRERVDAASALFDGLGGHTRVEEDAAGFLIRSCGCPLAATTARHPEACRAVESLVAEFVREPVANCCEREQRVRCFAVSPAGALVVPPADVPREVA